MNAATATTDNARRQKNIQDHWIVSLRGLAYTPTTSPGSSGEVYYTSMFELMYIVVLVRLGLQTKPI